MLLCGAALIIWPLWELCVRIDAMIGPLGMFWRLAMGEKIGVPAAVKYVDWSIFAAPALLAAYIILGVASLVRRKKSGMPMLLLAALAGLHMFYREAFFLPQTVRLAQLIPFAGIGVGSALNMLARGREKRMPKRPPRPKAFPLKKGR